MGIVFLYIQVPEIKTKDINITIMGQTESGSPTYVFYAQGRQYDLVKDVKNGDLIFQMLRFDQEDRISSQVLSQKLFSQYQKMIFEPEIMQFKDLNTFLQKLSNQIQPQVRILNQKQDYLNQPEIFLEGEYNDDKNELQKAIIQIISMEIEDL